MKWERILKAAPWPKRAMPRGVHDRLREYADMWATRGIRSWAEGWWSSPIETGNLLACWM